MAASGSNIFNRYIWLANTIYSAESISREDLDRRWAKCALNEQGESRLPERTFHRWRLGIQDLFGIIISCKKRTGLYYIENRQELSKSKMHQWLLDTFAVTAMIGGNKDIQEHILVESMPSAAYFLTPIMDAIRNRNVLEVTYKKFEDAAPHVFKMEPYCVKAFKQRWYMVGKSSDHPNEIRVYALDRIHDMKILNEPYTIPEDFDGKTFYKYNYGIYKGEEKPEKVVVQVSARSANYLRTLPLHESQKEIEQTEEYSVFEFFVAPTLDFRQELMTHGPELVVKEPQWLVDNFRTMGWKYTLIYPKEGK